MPRISSHKTPGPDFYGSVDGTVNLDKSAHSDHLHLGRALQEFEIDHHVKFEPHVLVETDPDCGKYFLYTDLDREDFSVLVDIHVVRNGEELCFKQNLDVPLLADDIIVARLMIRAC